jgi:hypothetical protein
VPSGDVPIVLDIVRKPDGTVAGTFTQRDDGVSGLPLAQLRVNGDSIAFKVSAASSGSFTGTIAGASISGTYALPFGDVPFALTRTGDPKFETAPVSRPVSKSLEGSWRGALVLDGTPLRLVLTLENHANGTATATVTTTDGGNTDIPAAVAQNGATVTVTVPATGAVFTAELNAAGTELAGTYSERGDSRPLTFSRIP